jgi:hypothetical protein
MNQLPIHIENQIYEVRGQKVMLDSDLASLYGVETRQLNQSVKRNKQRFPEDFMFQLTDDEWDSLKSQFVMSNDDNSLKSQNVTAKPKDGLKSQNATSNRGGRRTLPYAFTEHGTVMLASVLNSPTAIQASIQIVKAFVNFREILNSQVTLANKIDALENKYDDQFKQVFDAIRGLMANNPAITTIKKGRKD